MRIQDRSKLFCRGWIDTNGCPSSWHEIAVTDEGLLKLIHLDDSECEVSEYDLKAINHAKLREAILDTFDAGPWRFNSKVEEIIDVERLDFADAVARRLLKAIQSAEKEKKS